MTKQKYEELLITAEKYIGQEIKVKDGIDNNTGKITLTAYIFSKIGKVNILTEKSTKSNKVNENYSVDAILTLDNKKLKSPLLTVVEYYSKNKKYITV